MAILNWIWKLGCSSNSFKIFFHLLRQSKNISDFDKDDSFDRLFPNQDYHSGKGFGNLIALPIQALPRKEGNSVFLDPENNFEPAVDQWDFLYQVECISTTTLDKLYGKFSEDEENKPSRASKIKNGILPLTLAEYILIPRAAAPKELITFLREKLNFLNSRIVITL